MRFAWLLLLMGILVGAGAARAAASDASVRAARYYAEGLERPLLRLRIGAELARLCDRLKRACDDETRALAKGNNILDLLDALTLFAERPSTDVTAGIGNARALRLRITETGASLMRETADYDLALLARFGATLRACPREGSEEYVEALPGLIEAELTGFQALNATGAAAARERYAREERDIVTRLTAGARGDCVAARELGEYLMQLMHYKLRPWSGDESQGGRGRPTFELDQAPDKVAAPDDRELAQAVAGNFIAVIATELQLTAFPETAARIKELADQLGFPSGD